MCVMLFVKDQRERPAAAATNQMMQVLWIVGGFIVAGITRNSVRFCTFLPKRNVYIDDTTNLRISFIIS